MSDWIGHEIMMAPLMRCCLDLASEKIILAPGEEGGADIYNKLFENSGRI